MPITDAYIEEIERKINAGSNGDVYRMELSLLMAIYKKVECLEKSNKTNPLYKLGEAMRESKGFTFFLVFVMWILVILFPQMLVSLMGLENIVP